MQTVVVLLLGLLLLAERPHASKERVPESSGSEQPLDVCAPDLVEPPEFCSKSAQCTPLSQLGKMALQLCPKMCGLCIDAGDHIGRLQGAAARDNRAPHPRGVSRSSLPSTVATTATPTVTAFLPPVLDALQLAGTCQAELNTDYNGNDLPGYTAVAGTFNKCTSLCLGTPGCTHFTRVKRKCYLKSSNSGSAFRSAAVSATCHRATATLPVVTTQNKMGATTAAPTTTASATTSEGPLAHSELDACGCTQQYKPVCSATGMTYGNKCKAHCNSITSFSGGECNGVVVTVPTKVLSETQRKPNICRCGRHGRRILATASKISNTNDDEDGEEESVERDDEDDDDGDVEDAGEEEIEIDAEGNRLPNILFAIADDMSHASAYGHTFLQTPNFDRIGEEGVLFLRAYTPNSKCAPSRSTIVTGRNPWQLGAAANNKPYFPEVYKSVVDALADGAGYFTGYTGKGWGPGELPGPRVSLTGKEWNAIVMADNGRITTKVDASDYAANFDAFVAAKPVDAPFFFWFGCREPHRPYEEDSYVRFGKEVSDLKWRPAFWNKDERILKDVLDYAVEVEYFDQHLGRILDRIENGSISNQGNKRVNLSNTLIIATSDNAMPFPRFKGDIFEYASRMPLAIMWKGRVANPGRTSSSIVSFADFAPTFLDVAGISRIASGMQPIRGKSLSKLLISPTGGDDGNGASGNENGDHHDANAFMLTGRERNAAARLDPCTGYPARSIIKGQYNYVYIFEPDRYPQGDLELGYDEISNSPTKTVTTKYKPKTTEYKMIYEKRPQEMLFDTIADPDSMNNLALLAKFSSVASGLKAALFAALSDEGDPRMFGNGSIFEQYPRQKVGKGGGDGLQCGTGS
eukprot:gene11603-4544_t